MTAKTEGVNIANRLAAAISGSHVFGPEALRAAIRQIKRPGFTADAEDQEVIAAFVALLEKRADRKERLLREAFGRSDAEIEADPDGANDVQDHHY